MTRRELLASNLALVIPQGRLYTFHVLGLLHPRKLVISPQPHARLIIKTARGWQSLEGSQSLSITAGDTPVAVASDSSSVCAVSLEIPGAFRRSFRGELRILCSGDELVPLLAMDSETAVSSVTSAELPVRDTPREALMAQAVAARSFLTATAPRHIGYDFCDTTHCQFLRSPAPFDSAVDRAVRQTAGVTLQYQRKIVPCRYSAACGGHTDGRDELGYHYQPVQCAGCLVNHYKRRGHGLGLCQEGAIHLARIGWTYERILAHYLPGTSLSF